MKKSKTCWGLFVAFVVGIVMPMSVKAQSKLVPSRKTIKMVKINEPLDGYYKQHIGEMVCDFDMFHEPRVKSRLQKLMGIQNFNALTEIYQVQGDIQYNAGMFWGSGFKAHQCCDPATVWAYDTYDNSFYVWIRNDGKDYCWSESGSIPIKFKEVVNDRF